MTSTYNAPLSSAEISQIWTTYQEDTASICMLKSFVKTVEDPEISALLQHALELSESHIPKLTNFSQVKADLYLLGLQKQTLV
ncbi:DUF3231 family protein [Oceanobacillus aidingensis]|uniref:DUF3231 family protein n=1 Tax=Oceanobacillus aidingensis TaxID=645964 RepID=A0ABV9JVR3_9BACI